MLGIDFQCAQNKRLVLLPVALANYGLIFLVYLNPMISRALSAFAIGRFFLTAIVLIAFTEVELSLAIFPVDW